MNTITTPTEGTTMGKPRLSDAQIRALEDFAEAGGHGFGEHAFLSRATARSLVKLGLVVLGSRDLGGGRRMGWGHATDAGRDVLHQLRAR